MMIEVMTALLCANIPAMPALYRHWFGKTKVQSASAANNNTKDSSGHGSVRMLSAMKKPFRQSHAKFDKHRHTTDHLQDWQSRVSERKESTKTAHSACSPGSDTTESTYESHDLAKGCSDANVSAGHPTLSRNMVSLWPFKKQKSSEFGPGMSDGPESPNAERPLQINRTYCFDVKTSEV